MAGEEGGGWDLLCGMGEGWDLQAGVSGGWDVQVGMGEGWGWVEVGMRGRGAAGAVGR